VGKPEGRDKDICGWIILKLILKEIRQGVMDWIDLAQDRAHWKALVNMVINLWVK
jgi:hypothetical protein